MTLQRRAYSPAEVAESLGVSVRTVQRLIAAGELEYVPVGSRRRISVRMVDAWLETRGRTDGRDHE